MASVIKLVLEGDAASLKKAIDDGSLSLSTLTNKSRESINSFAKWGAAGTVAGAAIIAGVVNSSRKSIDVLAKKSDQLGIATEKLVAFQHLGELTGVSSEKMNSSLERMSKRLGEAAQGMGAARPQLERLNLSAEELVNLSPDKQYEKIAEAVKGLSTQSEKAAATAAIFGREGLALLNTMEAGAEGFKAAEADVLAFGTAISRVDAAKVEAANDSFERVQEVLKGVATQLTVKLAPVMKVVADRFVNAAKQSGGFTDQVVGGMNLAIEAVAFLGDTIRGLEVVWKVVEVAALGFVAATITALDELQKTAVNALDWIPGVDIAPSDALAEWAEESRQALMMTTDELGKLIDAPMPSTQVKKFFNDIKVEAQDAAKEIVAAKEVIAEPVSVAGTTKKEDASIQTEIDAQAAKYVKLREMAEQFQLGEQEREIARFERENEQFNVDLEKLVENGLIVEEAYEVQRQAREDAEAIHQNNLLGLAKKTAEAEKKLRGDVVNNALNLGVTLLGDTKAAAIAGIAITKARAIAETIQATATASTLAYASQLIPGDPTSVARAIAAAASTESLGAINVGLIAATGLAEVGQAHAGTDFIPEDQTIVVKKREMVLDPGTSDAVREAAVNGAGGGGSITIGDIIFNTTLTTENAKEYVRETIIPQLKDAIRDGELFGRGAFA
jgi:hypothetical protein